MVSELHKRGYQRLRIVPGMAPSGIYWRCAVTPAANIRDDHGALPRDWDGPMARYSSGDENRYFGWTDATKATARDLADMFVERLPEIVTAGEGRDWGYVGWFLEMLGLAEAGRFPIAYADSPGVPEDRLLLTHSKDPAGPQFIPLPPPVQAR